MLYLRTFIICYISMLFEPRSTWLFLFFDQVSGKFSPSEFNYISLYGSLINEAYSVKVVASYCNGYNF